MARSVRPAKRRFEIAVPFASRRWEVGQYYVHGQDITAKTAEHHLLTKRAGGQRLKRRISSPAGDGWI